MRVEALSRLLTWFSPSFPIGGFSWSHGLEYAVEAGLVADRDSLVRWVGAMLEHGPLRADATLFAEAWRAVAVSDRERLREAAELAAALRASSETSAESRAQGASFLKPLAEVWDDSWAAELLRLWREEGVEPSLAVAMGAVCGSAEISLGEALAAFVHGTATGLVWAGVKLVPLGQTDGLRAIATLETTCARATARAETSSPEGIGAAAPVIDWCCMRHETQYTRLFRS